MEISVEPLVRPIKLRESFLLGAVNLQMRGDVPTLEESLWNNILNWLAAELEKETGFASSLVVANESIDDSLQKKIIDQDRTARYQLLASVGAWKQGRLTIADLGGLPNEVLTFVAVQCDGLVGVMDKRDPTCIAGVDRIASAGGKWLGYLQIDP